MSHLNFNYSDFTDKDLEKLERKSSVTSLDIQGTDLTDDGLAHLVPMTSLSELRLKDNPQLTDGCIPHLSKLSYLSSIHIENTAISVVGLRNLLENVGVDQIILGSEFNESIEKLLALSALYPTTEILFKGRGIIFNGQLEE
jgi:hypothetical protein